MGTSLARRVPVLPITLSRPLFLFSPKNGVGVFTVDTQAISNVRLILQHNQLLRLVGIVPLWTALLTDDGFVSREGDGCDVGKVDRD